MPPYRYRPYTAQAVGNAAPSYVRAIGASGFPSAAPPPPPIPSRPQAAIPAPSPLDLAGTALRLGRGVDELSGGAISDALGLDRIPNPISGVRNWIGEQLFGPGQVDVAGGIDAAVNAGMAPALNAAGLAAGQAASALPAGYGAMLAGEAGLLPGAGGATAAYAGFPGFAALAPAAVPLGIIGGMALLSRLNDKPSVGENFAVRFGRGDDGGLTLRQVGMDNSTDTVGRDAFAGWTRDILGDALGQAQVTDNLDGALVFFPNPRVNGGAGSFGARVGDETSYYATPVDALKAFVVGQHRQGRVVGDLPQVLGAIHGAVAARGTLADAVAPAYLATVQDWVETGGPAWLQRAEQLAAKAQRAYGAFGGAPPEFPDFAALRANQPSSGVDWLRDPGGV